MRQRKVWIYPAIASAALDELKAVLAALPCVVLIDSPEGAEVILVAIGKASRNDPSLREALAGAADRRFRVIGVYVAPDDDVLPPAVGDTQTGLVPLDADLLERTICGGEQIRLDGIGGTYVPPKVDRHCGKGRC